MRVARTLLQAAVMIAVAVPLADGHVCGDQGTDNRPNHCEVKRQVDGEEVLEHRASSCEKLPSGECEYTHCDGSTKLVIQDDKCCCRESSVCTGAGYIMYCIGTSIAEVQDSEDVESKEWKITKVSTSNTCHVQLTTAANLGAVVSYHDTRKAACLRALELHDESATDSGKCFAYGGGTVAACKKEGVTLPQ